MQAERQKIMREIEKRGFYNTRTELEKEAALELHDEGKIKSIANGGSIENDGKRIVIINCKG